MKKLIINTVLVAITITAAAQTSRRDGRTSEEKNNPQNQRKTEVKSDNSNRRENPANTNTKTDSRKEDNKTEIKRDNNQNRENPSNNTRTGSGVNDNRRDNNQGNNQNRENNRDNNRYEERSGNNNSNTSQDRRHVDNRGTRVYHSDRVYVTPRNEVRKDYHNNNRPVRHVEHNHNYVVREPSRVHVVWDVHMHRDYCNIYPYVRVWRIPVGTPIYSISSYDAYEYVGDVKRVYGYVNEIYYDQLSDEYHLYLGDYFPYQEFTVIVPGYVARQITRRPYRYFMNQFIWSTGYISEFDDRPEMVIKRSYQLGIY